MPDDFEVKDSGERQEYASGMVRDTQEGKPDWALVFDGPLLERYATHLTKGAVKYGRRNWQLAGSDTASTEDELARFISSAARHMAQWVRGDRDEDHAAAVVFNLNAAEYVRERMAQRAHAVALEARMFFGDGRRRLEPPDAFPDAASDDSAWRIP